jgi:hypothetical protein
MLLPETKYINIRNVVDYAIIIGDHIMPQKLIPIKMFLAELLLLPAMIYKE